MILFVEWLLACHFNVVVLFGAGEEGVRAGTLGRRGRARRRYAFWPSPRDQRRRHGRANIFR